jgi:hypothetical protein
MRAILAATALLTLTCGLGAAPAQARDYPWCSRTSATGFNPDCAFTSYPQCMATVSGQRGDCMRNPYLAFSEEREARRKGRQPREQAPWDNGWGPRW